MALTKAQLQNSLLRETNKLSRQIEAVETTEATIQLFQAEIAMFDEKPVVKK